MTTYLKILVAAIVCLFTHQVYAQTPTATPTSTPAPTSTPLPWSPDPNAIFADGVQWEVVPPTPEPPTETPVVYPTYDSNDRLACGGEMFTYEPWDEDIWVEVSQNGEEYLCNKETGEEHHKLPPKGDGYYYVWDVYTTPDPTKLLLILGFEIFAYDLTDESYIKLGDAIVWSDSDMLLCRWITDTSGVLCSRERQGRWYFPEEYFVFDITQPDSVQPAFKGWENDVFYEEDLNRYISFYGYMYALSIDSYGLDPDTRCHITVYDAQGLREKELGHDCLPVFNEENATPFYRYGDYLYYIVVNEDETRRTNLYRYSIADEIVTKIIDDFEVKNIIGVSPDEQYIIVLTDTDLKRSAINPMGDQDCCLDGYSWQVAVLEIETGDLVYNTDDLGIYRPEQLIWVDDTTFLLNARMSFSDLVVNGSEIKLESLWRIELPKRDDVLRTVKILTMADSSLESPSPNALYGFSVYDGFKFRRTLIDLRTFESVPLVREDSDYALNWEWESDHALLISVSPRYSKETSITYRVILP